MEDQQQLLALIDEYDLEACREWLLDIIHPYWDRITAIGGDWPPSRPYEPCGFDAIVPGDVHEAQFGLAMIDRLDWSPDPDDDFAAFFSTIDAVALDDASSVLTPGRYRRIWSIIKLVKAMKEEQQMVADANLGRDNRTARRKTRLGKTKLKDVPDLILQVAYGKHRGKRDWLQQVTNDVVLHSGEAVGAKTVSTELRIRGIKE
jgi:hypothetical protein